MTTTLSPGMAPRGHRARSGVTLIELMVVIVALAIMASVVSLATRARPTRRNDVGAQISAARTSALSTGRPVNVLVQSSSGVHVLTALPDGSVLADGSVHVNPLTGLLDRNESSGIQRTPSPVQ